MSCHRSPWAFQMLSAAVKMGCSGAGRWPMGVAYRNSMRTMMGWGAIATCQESKREPFFAATFGGAWTSIGSPSNCWPAVLIYPCDYGLLIPLCLGQILAFRFFWYVPHLHLNHPRVWQRLSDFPLLSFWQDGVIAGSAKGCQHPFRGLHSGISRPQRRLDWALNVFRNSSLTVSIFCHLPNGLTYMISYIMIIHK